MAEARPRTPEHKYTVFVGGAEVNDHLLTWGQAVLLSQSYEVQGYDDVAIVDVTTDKVAVTHNNR